MRIFGATTSRGRLTSSGRDIKFHCCWVASGVSWRGGKQCKRDEEEVGEEGPQEGGWASLTMLLFQEDFDLWTLCSGRQRVYSLYLLQEGRMVTPF